MAILGQLFLGLLGRRRRYRVAGHSMSPLLDPGDLVWVDPYAYQHDRPKEGQIVVTRHPYRRDILLVKRVARVLEGESLILGGDNPGESTDSRIFGPLPGSLILGQAVACLRRESGEFLDLRATNSNGSHLPRSVASTSAVRT
jgi:nickel-type superoxide dismutase maturation protease